MGNEGNKLKQLHTGREKPHRRIAVLSGKGGTGKTFVAVNLAAAAAMVADEVEKGPVNVQYVDCDVEEPNGHLFFKPVDNQEQVVQVMVPAYDPATCNGCRICTAFCRFNALAYVRNQVRLFPELCHGCGGCVMLCPTGAMTESARAIGKVMVGTSGSVSVMSGMLNTGEATGVPVIHALMKTCASRSVSETVVLMDCPPGSGCAVMECIREADACILVVEPTPFGLHDLGMVAELTRKLGKPAGLLFNRCSGQDKDIIQETCMKERMPMIGEIPFSPDLAHLLAEGGIAVRVDADWRHHFSEIWKRVLEEEKQ